MVSIGSLEKIEILEVKEFMPSEVRLKCLKNTLFKSLKLPLHGNFVEFILNPQKVEKSRNFGPEVEKSRKASKSGKNRPMGPVLI